MINALWSRDLKDLNEQVKKIIGNELNLFQNEALGRLIEYLKHYEKLFGIISMPTGTGKTRLASTFLLYLYTRGVLEENDIVFWLAPRNIILHQARENELRKVLKDYFVIKSPQPIVSLGLYYWGKTDDLLFDLKHQTSSVAIYLVTPQLFHSLMGRNDFLDLIRGRTCVVIILDEVHHTFVGQKISDSIKSLLNFENVKIALGLSATPTWKAKQLLQNILYSSTTERAMKEGILIKGLKIYSTQTKVNIDANLLSEWQFYRKLYKDIGLNEQYPMNEWQVAIYERAEKYAEKIIEVLKEEVGENSLKCRIPKTLVIAANTKEADEIQNNLVELIKQHRGEKSEIPISVAHYKTGSREKAKEEILRFVEEKGEGILITVNMADMGFDDRNLEALVIARPVNSALGYIQIKGRVLRNPDRNFEDNIKLRKGYAVLIDLTGAARHEQETKKFEEDVYSVKEESEEVVSDLRGYDPSGEVKLIHGEVEVGKFEILKIGEIEPLPKEPEVTASIIRCNTIDELKQIINKKLEKGMIDFWVEFPPSIGKAADRYLREIEKTHGLFRKEEKDSYSFDKNAVIKTVTRIRYLKFSKS